MAATLTGTIKVELLPGSFGAGTIYTGDFSYDDTYLTKVGIETMTISDLAVPGLLFFNFRFLDFATGLTPVTYTAKDIVGFPDNPTLYFENGIPTQFGAMVDPGNNGGIWTMNDGFMFADTGRFDFILGNGTNAGVGTVTLELNKPTSTEEPPSVPENSSPLAFLLATLGLGASYSWKKSVKVNS
ncbi:MAG: hypothetical protein HC916_10900 [Coleofasciculaceae cyanobacterium SM2_1_6]|nr:hypothetical protein [Coleofasciculaceae cyanobacterium SM2_1_6]